MKLRCITMLLGIGLGLAAQAFAQTAISPSVKSASTISQTDLSAIKQFVQAQTARLTSTDPVQQAAGREALSNATIGEPPASAAFNDAYSQAVNDAMLPLADDASVRVRLNAAIVVSRVASRTATVRLKPAALKFIADKADPVVLWAVKAHGSLIPAQLRMQPKADDPLLKGLAPALKGHLSSPIILEAYEALRLNIVQDRKNVTPEMIKAVVPTMQELLALRISEYQNGVPSNPIADTIATTFLVDGDVWRQQTPAQRTRSAQLIVDLLASAAARTASFDNDRDGKDALIQTIRFLSSAAQVMAGNVGKPQLGSAAMPVAKVDLSMPAATIIQICQELIVQFVADVPGLTRPNGNVKPMSTAPAQ